MKTKYISLLICIMLALVSAGCSDHDEMNIVGGGPQTTNLRLRIAMSSNSPSTRATENPTGGEIGDGLRVGQYNENSIYSIYLYCYTSVDGINAAGNTPVRLLAFAKDVNFHPAPGDIKADKTIEKIIDFKLNDYVYNTNDQFIAAINTSAALTSTTLGGLRNELITQTVQNTLGGQIKDCDRFAMSNADDSEFKGGIGIETDPYEIEIKVERLAARIDFAYSKDALAADKFGIDAGNGYYEYAVEGNNDKVHLTHVRATNVMQAPSYLIKRLAADKDETPSYLADETNPATKYVVEPTTWSKNLSSEEHFGYWFGDSRYTNASATYNTGWFRDQDKVSNHFASGSGHDAFTDGTSLDEVDNDWNYYILGYANENTMIAENTLHNYTTGLVLKATYCPENVYKMAGATPIVDTEYVNGDTFWRWHSIDHNVDMYFSSQSAAEEYAALQTDHSVIFPYQDAQCYYNVWLRHENIVDDPTTTMMEFGIVRNNIYRVCVEFTGIGMPDLPLDMETPENIRMFIFVRKWNLITHPVIEI